MSSETAISVRGLGKTYRIATAQSNDTLLSEIVLRRLRTPWRRREYELLHALREIEFDVKKGETLGIIGRNGAGKSTLLKILSRVTEPTRGRVEIHGRAGALLEVGTGFHPELTGRENVYLNGAMLGMRKREIDRQFDSIVEFSGVGRFLDVQVKRFSSGMYVRLAFSVAAHFVPDILIVDEVLAVGDAEFQKKCIKRMGEVSTQQGRTVLFVSHMLFAVEQICDRSLYLEEGRIVFDGPTREAIEKYTSGGKVGEEGSGGVYELADVGRVGLAKDRILKRITICDRGGDPTEAIWMGEPLTVVLEVDGLQVPRHAVQLRVKTELGQTVFTVNTRMTLEAPKRREPAQVVCRLPPLNLLSGRYWIDTEITVGTEGQVRAVDAVERAARFDVWLADPLGTGYKLPEYGPEGLMFLTPDWEFDGERGASVRKARQVTKAQNKGARRERSPSTKRRD